MARPPKVGGIRTTRIGGEAAEPEAPALPDVKTGIYQFRSKAPAFRISVRRRRIERGPDGETMEVAPRTKDEHDLPLDLIKFEDNYFETPSKEQADALIGKMVSLKLYGMGLEVWSVEEERQAMDNAFEKELRDRIAARPDIAARVLKPSDAEDFALPAPPAA
jgi:hypothetical protein